MSRDRVRPYRGGMRLLDPLSSRHVSLARASVLATLALLLTGCDAVVLHPGGDVARQQRDLLLISTGLMLLIIVPVIALTAIFAWRYRQSNGSARYEPDWDHSTQLELMIWGAPLLIVIFLGALTWMGTHLLDPYRALGRIDAHETLNANVRPLEVQVVALDWKWLFIYPEFGIATINELAAPVNRPITFSITSGSVMNSFYIPALAGQIYAMPGMETSLHAVMNRPGDYEGFSANYSGAGFSGMRFRFHSLSENDFRQWVQKVKHGGGDLDRGGYLALERASENEPVRRYAAVAPDLYHAALNMCVEPGKMCADTMMRIDARGGLGLSSAVNVLPLTYDKYARRGTAFGPQPSSVASICVPGTLSSNEPWRPADMAPRPDNQSLVGSGLSRPNPMTSLQPLTSFRPVHSIL
jgi:cytochrome o ubiquinol oxidase subunit 2